MVATVKLGLKAFTPSLGSIDSYLQRMLLIPHGNQNASPSALMGRQIRSPITLSFQTGDEVWYRTKPCSVPEAAIFVSQAGQNTAVILRGDNGSIAHTDQINIKNEDNITSAAGKDSGQDSTNKERNVWTDVLLKEAGRNDILSDEEIEDLNSTPDHVENTPPRKSTRSTLGKKPERFV